MEHTPHHEQKATPKKGKTTVSSAKARPTEVLLAAEIDYRKEIRQIFERVIAAAAADLDAEKRGDGEQSAAAALVPEVRVRDPLAGDYARQIERGCLRVALEQAKDRSVHENFRDGHFREIYSDICYFALGHVKPSLIASIRSGRLETYTIASRASHELLPELTADLREELRERSEQKVEQRVSEMVACPKCKNKKSTMREYQGRAVDEASTFSRKCTECSHIWRS